MASTDEAAIGIGVFLFRIDYFQTAQTNVYSKMGQQWDDDREARLMVHASLVDTYPQKKIIISTGHLIPIS